MQKIYLLILTLYTLVYFGNNAHGQVLGLATEDTELTINDIYVDFYPELLTETAFDQKEIEEYEDIPFETILEDDKDLEYGNTEVKVAGVPGVRTNRFLLTYWVDEVIDKVLLSTEEEPPVSEVISVGKKVVWRELDTPEYGTIKYWGKLEVFATKYDSTCLGCNNTTALGAPVKQGVCAVDPKTIKMYTHFYVPGYGKCQALDVGGLIKGNKIDLAYEDAKIAPWGAEYVTIYLMDNVPE